MAKRFEFRLEAVRQLRKRARDRAARSVALQQAVVNAVAARTDEFADRLEAEQASGRSHRETVRLDMPELRSRQYHSKWLEDQIAEASNELRSATAELALERDKLGRSLAALKGIEKLRERCWTTHLRELQREEQAETDEIAGMRDRFEQCDQGVPGC